MLPSVLTPEERSQLLEFQSRQSVTERRGINKFNPFIASGGTRQEEILNRTARFGKNKMTFREAIKMSEGDPQLLGAIRQDYWKAYKGSNLADKGRIAREVGSVAFKGLKSSYKAGNILTKVALGASLGQLGAAGAILGGLGLLAGGALGISGDQVVDTAKNLHREIKAANRPVYGHSELGSSVSGLTLGLHRGRHG